MAAEGPQKRDGGQDMTNLSFREMVGVVLSCQAHGIVVLAFVDQNADKIPCSRFVYEVVDDQVVQWKETLF